MKHFGWGTVAGLGLAGLLVAATAAQAEGGAAGETGGAGQTGQTGMGETGTTGAQEVIGTVEKFDPSKKELTLTTTDKTLKLTDDTQIMKEGQRASLSDIQEGAQVRASYSGTGDTVQVTQIEVMSAAPPGGTGTPGGTGGGMEGEQQQSPGQ
jgi:Cu/Ag efflux protein CusF